MSKIRGAKSKKCRHCGNPPHSRGVCPKHYQAGWEAIRRKEITDEELVAKGYWSKAANNGPRHNPAIAKILESTTRK